MEIINYYKMDQLLEEEEEEDELQLNSIIDGRY
jgi:hypothetical protein